MQFYNYLMKSVQNSDSKIIANVMWTKCEFNVCNTCTSNTPPSKIKALVIIIPMFLSHGMGRTVDKDLRWSDYSFLWTHGRAVFGADRLLYPGLVLDCYRSGGSICAGFYFILVWINKQTHQLKGWSWPY